MTLDQAIRKALRTVAMYPDEGPLVVYKLGRGFDVYEVGGTLQKRSVIDLHQEMREVNNISKPTLSGIQITAEEIL